MTTVERAHDGVSVEIPNVAGGDNENLAPARRNEFGEARDDATLDDRQISLLRGRNAILGHLVQLCHWHEPMEV